MGGSYLETWASATVDTDAREVRDIVLAPDTGDHAQAGFEASFELGLLPDPDRHLGFFWFFDFGVLTSTKELTPEGALGTFRLGLGLKAKFGRGWAF